MHPRVTEAAALCDGGCQPCCDGGCSPLCGEGAVWVLVPNSKKLHTEIAAMALDAGRHVLLEKPIARNLSEGRDLANKARRIGDAVPRVRAHSSPCVRATAHTSASVLLRPPAPLCCGAPSPTVATEPAASPR